MAQLDLGSNKITEYGGVQCNLEEQHFTQTNIPSY